MTQLEPNDLLLFARVVEEGSFSRAADKLGIPVSTASRRITALEKQLGERLLLRTTRKLTVTELGLAVAEHARQVQQSTEAAVALADNRQLRPTGRLRVSVPAELPLLAPFLAEFVSSHPGISLQVDASMRVVDLIGENFDLALRLRNVREDATLVARPVMKVRAGLYASPAYLKARGTPKDPEALLEHQTVQPMSASGEPIAFRIERGKEHWEGLPAGRILTNSPGLGIGMAIEGAGIVVAMEGVAEPYVKTGALVRVLPDWEFLPATLWAVFAGRRLMPARTRAFIDALTNRFGSMGK